MSNKPGKDRIGIVGCGGRGIASFIMPAVARGMGDRIVALCDVNTVRLGIAAAKLGRSVPAFTDYDEFLAKGNMDVVLITTPDYLHCPLALKAFAAGKHVITEKPMAISVTQCDQMIAAAQRANRDLRVAFNLRYSPTILAAVTLLKQGVIGNVVALQSDDYRNIGHGSDYYRRWHRQRQYSGGMLIHKGCHTFDVLNWMAQARPVSVYAMSSRRYFKPRPNAGQRCKTCDQKQTCEMYVDLDVAIPTGVPWKGFDHDLYANAEHVDGYYRDQCVFGQDVDLQDNIQILARYENGIALTYNLLMFCPYSERSFGVTGTNGRLELGRGGSWVYPTFQGGPQERQKQLFVENAPQREAIDPPTVLGQRGQKKGSHGGADGWLLTSLLEDDTGDPSKAGGIEGRHAIMLAEAAYLSMERGQPVDVEKEFGMEPNLG